MSNYQYETTWKVLREYNFDISEIECRELICVLCKKLLIEANEAPCACKFCASCIEEYISNGNTMCPGNTNECREEILLLGVNVNNHSVTNRKISKLKLKCPSNGCSYEDILSNMDHHLMLCGRQSTVCPYLQMGCSKIGADKNEITNHLQMESYEHAQMVKEMFSILKNEIEYLTKEIQILKPYSDKQQVTIENLQSRINKMELSTVRQSDQSVAGSGEIGRSNVLVIDDVYDYRSSLNELESVIGSESFLELESDTESVISVATSVSSFLSHNVTTYEWNIHEFSTIRKLKSYDSESFYIKPNKCLIKLRLLPVVRKNARPSVSIYPNCIPGRYDRFQEWPIKCEITIGIINQRSGHFLNKNTKTIYYFDSAKSPVPAFELPINERFAINMDCLLIKCFMKIV